MYPRQKFEADKLRLKDRPFIYRYPRAFVITTTTLGLGVLFSKPLYDFFFGQHMPYTPKKERTEASK